MKSSIEELESLLFDWEAGTLDDTGVERVRELLRRDEAARTFYTQQQVMNAALKLDVNAGLVAADLQELSDREPTERIAGRGSGERPEVSAYGSQLETNPPTGRVFRVSYWVAGAAALLICVLVGRVLQLELGDRQTDPVAENLEPRDDSREPTSEGIALVTRLVDVVWKADQKPVEVGDALSPGRLAIQSGFAQIEFFCGATVIAEGPAELDLRSPLLAKVHSGRLRAQVPPAARGFSLEVDDLKVVDLGTEFGLSVSTEGANVQVFDGEVELHQPQSDKKLLKAGKSVVRAPDGSYSESPVTPARFLDIAKLESRAASQRDERYGRWKAWSHKLRRDERLIAYYAFDQTGGWERRLSSSLEPENKELDGAIVGAKQVAGRWPTKGGLEFKRPGDRVRVQIPGEFRSLTFACWVKIDSLDRWYNSLFLTDHYDKGEPHWQILDDGRLYFSVRPAKRGEPGPRDFKALSPPFWNAGLSGRWMHLAVAYDIDAGTISHYLNGERLSRHEVPAEQVVPTRIGAASIGNWSLPTQPDAEFAIRNLNGSLDEFVIFGAALPADEIQEMYEHGRP